MSRTAPYQTVYIDPFFEVPTDVINVKAGTSDGVRVGTFTEGATETSTISLPYNPIQGIDESGGFPLAAPGTATILDQIIVRNPGGIVTIDVVIETEYISGADEILYRVAAP